MKDIEAIIKHVKQGCRDTGKQFTAKRLLILRALAHADKAMSVYRVLDFLEQHHLAHKIKVSNKYILCDHILCEHEHVIPQFLICSKCDKISEQTINPSIIRDLKSQAKQQGFTVTSPQIEISCVCDECAKPEINTPC